MSSLKYFFYFNAAHQAIMSDNRQPDRQKDGKTGKHRALKCSINAYVLGKLKL